MNYQSRVSLRLKLKLKTLQACVYSLIAPAKINLYLEYLVLARWLSRAMVLQSINLADQIQYEQVALTLFASAVTIPVPTDKSNLAYQAAELMATQFSNAFAQYGGVEITIHKRIPRSWGLH